jgi:hypothetical protein
MDIIINELSLSGQFNNEDDFLNNLEKLLPIINLIEKMELVILKNYSFFDSQIMPNKKLNEIIYSKDSRVRKFKSYILKLAHSPLCWENTQKHSCKHDSYTYNSTDICGKSLAEASQRDKLILSFKHDNFNNEKLQIKKNDDNIDLINILSKDILLNNLYKNNKISTLDFYKYKFLNSNLNFEKLETTYGFDKLNNEQTNVFIKTFNVFSTLEWSDIRNHRGFDYKPYHGDCFKVGDKKIHKFRVSKKYRCFGYRQKDIFYILRFETSHKMSDSG